MRRSPIGLNNPWQSFFLPISFIAGKCRVGIGNDYTPSAESQKIDFADYGRIVCFTVTFQTSNSGIVLYTIRCAVTSW